MSNGQSVKAVAKYVRISPHKVRQVLDQIRGRSYQEALMILEFLPSFICLAFIDISTRVWINELINYSGLSLHKNIGLIL